MTNIEKLLADYYKTIDLLKEHGHELAPDEPLHEKVLNLIAIIKAQRELLKGDKDG